MAPMAFATREGPQRTPLPPPAADEVWAALNAWIAANPEIAGALPAEFSAMAARHASRERHTDWRFYAAPAARLLGYALLLGGTLLCDTILAVGATQVVGVVGLGDGALAARGQHADQVAPPDRPLVDDLLGPIARA